MGSQAKQADLWGKRPDDWSAIQEQTGSAGYDYALQLLNISGDEKLLDVGCGTGVFCELADGAGAHVTGIDATEAFIERAEHRLPGPDFIVGEMEELPFEDESFDIVTGFNSFQYAENPANALKEALRVLKPGGTLVAMIWGEREDCEAASFLKAAGSLMPPLPPGAPGPFAMTENHLLESVLKEAGFDAVETSDIPSIWHYPDEETALKGLISAGPISNAIAHSGLEKVTEMIRVSMQPYAQPDGSVTYHNKFRIVSAKRPL